MNNTVAIYPGSFDPVTRGHVDIACRAASLFQQVIVAVARDRSTVLPLEQRVELAQTALSQHKNIKVMPFSALLADFAIKQNARFLIRGLRAVSDFDYEFQMAIMNKRQNPDLETIFLMSAEKYQFLSSSVVRELASCGGDISELVPEPVGAALSRLYEK